MVFIEIVNFILSILSVYLLSKNDKRGWVLSIFVCLVMAYIYHEKSLWYQFVIQFVFLIQSIIAYFKWSKQLEYHLKKASMTKIITFYSVFILVSLYWVNNDTLSYVDLLLMFISLVANHLLIYKKAISWYLWLLFDIISIILCLYLSLYITVVLFIILMFICLKTIITNYEKV